MAQRNTSFLEIGALTLKTILATWMLIRAVKGSCENSTAPFHQAEFFTCYLAGFAETELAGAGGGPSGWHTPVVPPATPI